MLIASRSNVYNPSCRILNFCIIFSWHVNSDLLLYEALQILHSYKVEEDWEQAEGGEGGEVKVEFVW